MIGKKDRNGQVIDQRIKIYGVEDLKIKNMTKAPAPQPDENNPGHFLPNQAQAKAGLNKKILHSAWGLIVRYLTYKANQAGKIFIRVPPQFSSQECAMPNCGHVHPDNRQTQNQFVCQKCGHTANADQNAAEVIKKRAVEQVLKQITLGIRESARRGNRQTRRVLKPRVQARRSENRRRQSLNQAELIPGSSVL
jgi:putative transposase